MAHPYPFLLTLHILAGTLALGSGTIVLFIRKGDRNHRRTGRVFHYAMLATAASALALSVLRPNAFLLWIGLFTLYMDLSGTRILARKNGRPGVYDIALTVLGAITAGYMLATGNVVLLVFGGICAVLVVTDIRSHFSLLSGRSLPPLAWLRRHIGFMMGAWIATFTAFLVVNASTQYGMAAWLAPSVVGVPLLMYWSRKFVKRPPLGAAR